METSDQTTFSDVVISENYAYYQKIRVLLHFYYIPFSPRMANPRGYTQIYTVLGCFRLFWEVLVDLFEGTVEVDVSDFYTRTHLGILIVNFAVSFPKLLNQKYFSGSDVQLVSASQPGIHRSSHDNFESSLRCR